MSEIINNREYRQEVLKELILELHQGKTVEEVKARFEKLIEGVTASEISAIEQSLIMDGMPIEEVQRLCDVHASVFKGSIEEIHKPQSAQEMPGHPVHTLILENRALERLIDSVIQPALTAFVSEGGEKTQVALLKGFKRLLEIDKHYSRKENLIFPYLEKYEITGPPKVMWGVDDEIRGEIKQVVRLLEKGDEGEQVGPAAAQALHKVKEMIFKEEHILIPMTMETFTEDEWKGIADESAEIGYCLVQPAGKWQPTRVDVDAKVPAIKTGPEDGIRFETGVLLQKEIEAIMNHLPVDITFIDKDDVVKYFSQGKDRIFARTKAVIGRTVQNCHPPASVHVVETMLLDFKSGKKEHEDFWIQMGPNFVYIRYFAVRDPEGTYLGTLEFTQNIHPIQQISGEKRLMSE